MLEALWNQQLAKVETDPLTKANDRIFSRLWLSE